MAIPKKTAQNPEISEMEFLRFRDFFYRKTGIMFEENKRYFVDKRLHQLMIESNINSFRDYFNFVCLQESRPELQALINAMTVNETYFYRETYQLECLVRSILPELVKNSSAGETIRIWSVPCSTGEEPYSIALYLLEHWNRVDEFDIEIVASDIDTEVLRKARLGMYSDRSLQHVPHKTISKYMSETATGERQVISSIRSSIRFTQCSILEAAGLNSYKHFDVVFCRNLLIYFDELSRREAAEVIYSSLNAGGFVCLGHSESMSRISSLFNLRKFPEAMVYQKPLNG